MRINLHENILFFDGAMGTMLQSKGLQLRELPEILNLKNPALITSIHNEYLNSGANFITSNTFGANRFKLANSSYTVSEIVEAGAFLAHEAVTRWRKSESGEYFSALDIGSTGKILAPIGDASFQEIYDSVAEQVIAGKKFSDVILLETFTDLYELKAAVLAAVENSDLPVFATMSFEASGRTFFGASVESMVTVLQDLGVAALGVNCSLGPKQLLPLVKKFCEISHVPVMIQPNAGLPVIRDNKTFYDITPDEFAETSVEFAKMGAAILGGCCGTTPEHISKMRKYVMRETHGKIATRKIPDRTIIASSSKITTFGEKFVIIGERLNPTGKKKLQQAIREQNFDYMINEALKQQSQAAKVLDLNVGLPDINEPEFLARALTEIQSVIDLPIQIDSSDYSALESAARIYNGKAILNSVNGKSESLEKVLPIAKKYGACVLGLTLDETGIPETATERFKIAEKIVNAAEKFGIPRRNILIDCLTLTASAQQKLVIETLKAVELVKRELGVCTVLGLSNVSFGLPRRSLLNRTMLIAALKSGLDAAIINPADLEIQESISAWNLLTGDEADIQEYITFCERNPGKTFTTQNTPSQPEPEAKSQESDIISAIKNGLKDEAANFTLELLKTHSSLEIIEKFIVPALDLVGKDYESGKLFLPQLIKSAEAAKSAFEKLQFAPTNPDSDSNSQNSRRIRVALATVYGDVHDIGKNIVKTIFENYNFHVYDLGKDVSPEKIIEAIQQNSIEIVGLSALMTTTVASMKDTIEKLRAACPNVKIIVGGAVLTPDLAKFAGADYYARDAMEGVRIISSLA